MVWRIPAPLATIPGDAAWCKAARDCDDTDYLRDFIMAGENDVGTHPAVGHPELPAILYVENSCR